MKLLFFVETRHALEVQQFAPEKLAGPKRKRESLPTIIFSGKYLSFPGNRCSFHHRFHPFFIRGYVKPGGRMLLLYLQVVISLAFKDARIPWRPRPGVFGLI